MAALKTTAASVTTPQPSAGRVSPETRALLRRWHGCQIGPDRNVRALREAVADWLVQDPAVLDVQTETAATLAMIDEGREPTPVEAHEIEIALADVTVDGRGDVVVATAKALRARAAALNELADEILAELPLLGVALGAPCEG